MRNYDLNIHGNIGNKIRVNETEIRADGGSLYPRLIIPVHLDLNPIKGEQDKVVPIIILGVKSALNLKHNKSNIKIADGLVDFNYIPVCYPNHTSTYNFEFPFDRFRLLELENRRSDDLRIGIYFRFHVGIYTKNQHIISDFESPTINMDCIIPQSHWVKNILPNLGIGEYFIVEIPSGRISIKKAWEYLDEAEKSFRTWNIKGVYGNCREIGDLLNLRIKKKFGVNSFTYKEKWLRSYKHLSSTALHLEEIKKSKEYSDEDVVIGKSDAEHLLIVTKAMLKYAEDLLRG